MRDVSLIREYRDARRWEPKFSSRSDVTVSLSFEWTKHQFLQPLYGMPLERLEQAGCDVRYK